MHNCITIEIVIMHCTLIYWYSWCKKFNLTVLKIDFTFDQDKKDCDVFIFGHKDFERVQAKWGIKSLHICVATSYVSAIESSIAYHPK